MSDWSINDKQWMQSRKEEWLLIRNHLEKTGLTVKETKSIERYYLKALKPENVKLVFKLWMHPNRSNENLMGIRNTVTSSDFYESCIFFNENIVAPGLGQITLWERWNTKFMIYYMVKLISLKILTLVLKVMSGMTESPFQQQIFTLTVED